MNGPHPGFDRGRMGVRRREHRLQLRNFVAQLGMPRAALGQRIEVGCDFVDQATRGGDIECGFYHDLYTRRLNHSRLSPTAANAKSAAAALNRALTSVSLRSSANWVLSFS